MSYLDPLDSSGLIYGPLATRRLRKLRAVHWPVAGKIQRR